MQAKNPRTGALITGELVMLRGEAGINDDSFRRTADGSIEFDPGDYTKIDWDSSDGRTKGDRVYIDEDGEHVPEADIVLFQEKTPETPVKVDDEPRAS